MSDLALSPTKSTIGSTTIDPLHSLSRLSSTTYILRPRSFTSSSLTIVLATWMNASPRNIAFYISKHRQLHPDARILLLRGTVPNMIYVPEAIQRRNLAPVLDALRAEPGSQVVLHAFSNAGAQQGSLLLRAYKEDSSGGNRSAGGENAIGFNGRAGKLLHLKGMIFDSLPGRGNYWSSYKGMAYELPKQPFVVNLLGLFVVHAVLIVYWLIEALTLRSNVLDQSCRDLNDLALVREDVSRFYMYSKEDELVKWEDIQWHADEARFKGWPTYHVLFKGSAHCRHAKGDGEERYWNIVSGVVGRMLS